MVRKSPTESMVILSAAMLLEATPIRDEHGRELT
jgi:hypothetical protein